MNRFFLLVFFCLTITSAYAKIGINENYKIVSNAKYSKKITNSSTVYTNFIVLPELFKTKVAKNISEYSDKDSIYISAMTLLSKGKVETVLDYLEQAKDDLDSYYLLKGLCCLAKMDYTNAKNCFEKEESEKYKFLNNLLLADCVCFFSYLDNYKDQVLEYYQKAYDSSGNDRERKEVKDRIRRYKYLGR